MSVTQEIKNRLDIVDIVSEHVALRKAGKNYSGYCPFHSNTRSPSFYVFPDTQTWHCFGACSEGGDVFNFLMKKEGWEFKSALEHLAQRAGVQLEELTPEQKKRRTAENKFVNLLTAAAEYFYQLLLHAPQAEAARQYVAGRQLKADTLETFRIGFALDEWNACRTHFNAQGYSDDDLLQVGLLTDNVERGARYDRFRNRLMIPIRDDNGRIVGFGARTLEKDGIPKYLNSPQTNLFDKSRLLFGLDSAKRHIREARQVVIVEGYMDVMQGWQAGFRNIVAQMGTALTEEQLHLLKRQTKRFVIALDADAAGVQATMRSLRVARETLDREYEVRFDARGLVRHEGRLQADIRVVTLPAGQDPDNIIRHDPDQWPQLLATAKPVVAYVIDMATRDLDMNDPKAKAEVAQTVLPLISDIPNPIERDHYRQELARALRVDERSLRLMSGSVLTKSTRRPAPPPPEQEQRPYQPSNGGQRAGNSVASSLDPKLREANFLRQCLQYPRIIVQVNRVLGQYNEPAVAESDFDLAEDRQLLLLLNMRAREAVVVSSAELCDSLDAVLAARVRVLLGLPLTSEEQLTRLPERLTLSVLDLRLAKAHEQLARARQLLQEPRSESGPDINLAQLYGQQVQRIQRLNKAKDAMSSVGRRRAESGYGR